MYALRRKLFDRIRAIHYWGVALGTTAIITVALIALLMIVGDDYLRQQLTPDCTAYTMYGDCLAGSWQRQFIGVSAMIFVLFSGMYIGGFLLTRYYRQLMADQRETDYDVYRLHRRMVGIRYWRPKQLGLAIVGLAGTLISGYYAFWM